MIKTDQRKGTDVKICKVCGAILSDKARFCPACGAPSGSGRPDGRRSLLRKP